MGNFAFIPNIPDGPNNPSQDQPNMKTNTNSDQSIWAVEHLGFNTNNGGTHLQTGFANFQSSPVLPSDPGANNPSVAYPNAGVADATNSQYYFKNPLATLPLSAVKAYGNLIPRASSGAIIPTNSFNVASVVQTNAVTTSIAITLNSNVTTGNDVTVLVFYANPLATTIVTYTFVAGVLTLTANSFSTLAKLNFLILQI